MKAKKVLVMLTTATMIAMGSLAFAQDYNAGSDSAATQDNNVGSDSAATQDNNAGSDSAATPGYNVGSDSATTQDNNAETDSATGKSVSQVQIHGVVEKTDDGVTLFDGRTTYLLKSENDLEPFVGKNVTVAGYGYTADTGMVVLVNQIGEFN